MEILNLIIKQKFFDEIMSGKKRQEYREIRPNTQKKYCQLDADGFCVEVNGELQPKHYDAINHNLIEYTHQGETYLAAQVVYDLGKVIEKHV